MTLNKSETSQKAEILVAINVIEKIISEHPSDDASLCEAGKFYFALLSYSPANDIQADVDFYSQKALEYFTQASELNNGLAHHYLGHLYHNGVCVKKDEYKALYHFEKAIVYGYFLSLQRIGYFYEQGLAVNQDIEKAVQCYEKVVTCGMLPKAQRATNSFGLYKKAGPIKRASIKNKLFHCYENKLIEDLLSNLAEVIENGLVTALTNLGTLYLNNKNIPQAKAKAHEYLNESAQLNCPVAQMILGKLYQEGLGVKKDEHHAALLYKKSASKGHAPSQVRLGNFYLNGLGGIPKDEAMAKHYFELSASQGNTNAYVSLGYCYHNGIGTPVNFEKALFYYQKAAEENHPIGLRNLGTLYYKGDGVEEDRERARLLWDKADEETARTQTAF